MTKLKAVFTMMSSSVGAGGLLVLFGEHKEIYWTTMLPTECATELIRQAHIKQEGSECVYFDYSDYYTGELPVVVQSQEPEDVSILYLPEHGDLEVLRAKLDRHLDIKYGRLNSVN